MHIFSEMSFSYFYVSNRIWNILFSIKSVAIISLYFLPTSFCNPSTFLSLSFGMWRMSLIDLAFCFSACFFPIPSSLMSRLLSSCLMMPSCPVSFPLIFCFLVCHDLAFLKLFSFRNKTNIRGREIKTSSSFMNFSPFTFMNLRWKRYWARTPNPAVMLLIGMWVTFTRKPTPRQIGLTNCTTWSMTVCWRAA